LREKKKGGKGETLSETRKRVLKKIGVYKSYGKGDLNNKKRKGGGGKGKSKKTRKTLPKNKGIKKNTRLRFKEKENFLSSSQEGGGKTSSLQKGKQPSPSKTASPQKRGGFPFGGLKQKTGGKGDYLSGSRKKGDARPKASLSDSRRTDA